MHGLMLKAIQSFAQGTYGPSVWAAVTRIAAPDHPEFEAMLTYDDDVAETVLTALAHELNRPRASVLEDIGTFLVSDPKVDRLRRLLRFTGVTYEDFLHSLDDLPGRARLAVPDLILPRLELRTGAEGRYVLSVFGPPQGFGHVMTGILRAMADEYGALVMLDHDGDAARGEEIEITLVEAAFTEARQFDLGGAAGAQ